MSSESPLQLPPPFDPNMDKFIGDSVVPARGLFRPVLAVFKAFDWEALSGPDRETLLIGIHKHRDALRWIVPTLIAQIVLAAIAPELFVLISVCSFIALGLKGAWYTISFQNVSAEQLLAGLAEFITLRMFRAMIMTFQTLIVGGGFFILWTIFPELESLRPEMLGIPLWIRIVVFTANLVWLVRVLLDAWQAAVAYDAADSLLGDGFPTLMRGARANAQALPVLQALHGVQELLILQMSGGDEGRAGELRQKVGALQLASSDEADA